MIIGYTTGVFDLFHAGHVNLLKNAKSFCDKLIVGVTVDDLVQYKGKTPVIPYNDRVKVVESCRYVDVAVPQESMDKLDAHSRYKFDLMFVGDDWYKTDKWSDFEQSLNERGVRIIYFPYTKGVSSTLINRTLEKLQRDDSLEK